MLCCCHAPFSLTKNASIATRSTSNLNPSHEEVETIVYAVLIEHLTPDLLLFESGCHDDVEKYWGSVSNFPSLIYAWTGRDSSHGLLVSFLS